MSANEYIDSDSDDDIIVVRRKSVSDASPIAVPSSLPSDVLEGPQDRDIVAETPDVVVSDPVAIELPDSEDEGEGIVCEELNYGRNCDK